MLRNPVPHISERGLNDLESFQRYVKQTNDNLIQLNSRVYMATISASKDILFGHKD